MNAHDKNLLEKEYTKPSVYSEVDLRNIKSTLVVGYVGRSGSYLFSNLIDGHSEILSCPPHSITQIIENIAKIQTTNKNNLKSVDPELIIKKIAEMHQFLFNDANHETKLGKTVLNMKVIGVDRKKFCKIAYLLIESHLEKYNGTLLHSDIFSLVHWSYALAIGKKVSTNSPTICWQRHSIITPELEQLILSNIPNPILITTVRRLEDALDSHLFVMSKTESFISLFENHDHMNSVLLSHFAFGLIKRKINIPALAIRFEDMHHNTEDLMRKLCKRLDLRFEAILLKTTLDQEIYYFESNGELKTGSNKKLKRKETFELLTIPDLVTLNILFCRHYKLYGYAFHQATINFVGCCPTTLKYKDLILLLQGIDQSGKSYLMSIFKNSNLSLFKMLEVDFSREPLELIG